MLKFIQNIGDYFSSNYFDEDFTSKVLAKTGYAADAIKDFNKQVAPLKDRYFRFKQLFIEGKLRTKDKVFEAHQFHTEVLNALGYDGAHTNYGNLFHLSESEVIPVRHILYRGDQPHLMIMEMQALIKEDDTEADGLFEQRYNVETEETTNPPQRYHRSQWERVFKIPADVKICPVVINKAISQLLLLEPHYRPKYILLLAGNVAFLLEQEKWFRGSYLQIDLEELFSEATANRNANYYALFYFLLGKETLAPESNMVLLDQLDEDSHKSAYEVTKDLKEGIIHAVEALANEALYYKKEKLHENFDETDDVFEQQVKDDCLKIIYRLLFIFYAESREDLDILPSNDSTYQKGYSLEMLRDLEQVPLYSDSSLNGYFFHESLSKLFGVLSSGYREKENGDNKSFKVRHIDSPLFNDATLKHLATVKFRNKVWQDIICRLSLSKQQRGKSRGRISYANLGINQLGSVYESLLAYRGFYAEQDYIEVHKANKPNEGTYLVPRSRRDDFEESEILKDGNGQAVIIKKGTFVYRLSGRDRQKSASYYTPEVLTQCTVKYTLKPILEKLDKGEMKATELLELKLLEPAMGAAAFHNEMINQLAEAYLVYRQEEFKKSGRTEWKVQPDKYREELQKVKAYIATNNVYGVDLNPTAIELGKLSLWLNVIHKDMETPFFSNRLAVGNAVVGAWLKVYKEKDMVEDLDSSGRPLKKQPKKEWWETAPRLLEFKPNTGYDKIKHGRKQDEIYHFLLPDKNMMPSASIKMLKEDYEAESKAVAKWKKDWIVSFRKGEIEQLKKICNKIDELLAEYYRFQRTINLQTASKHNIFGAYKNAEQASLAMRSYDEKERLNDQRNRHNAPYFKLKMVMDYWCSLWFWDVRQVSELPSRKQYWDDIANILELDAAKAMEGVIERKGQQRMFETANQLSMVLEGEDEDSDPEEATATQAFTEAVIEYANRKDLFDKNQRLEAVSNLAKQYHFFHPHLEFLEVFWERGGFDLIAGNPPWVNIEFDEAGVLSEKYPEVIVKEFSASDTKEFANKILPQETILKQQYLSESVWAASTKSFIGCKQNYPSLVGQRNNLYKCILTNSISAISNKGFIGLVHPEGVYDDPNGQLLRKILYPRLRYHFQFWNELFLFSEVHHDRSFSVNVYSGTPTNVSFLSISNLFVVKTVDASIIHDGNGYFEGIKRGEEGARSGWNTNPHSDRLVFVDENILRVIRDSFDRDSEILETKFIAIHSKKLLDILKKLSSKEKADEDKMFVSQGWNEVVDVKNGQIKKEFVSEYLDKAIIYSGAHFYISNPLYKTPLILDGDFNCIDLNIINSDYKPSSVFYQTSTVSDNNYLKWLNSPKVAFGKMLNSKNERTLRVCLLHEKSSHIGGVISVVFQNAEKTIQLCGLSSSIVFDFFLKITSKANLYEDTLREFPNKLAHSFKTSLFARTLVLNRLTQEYRFLWEKNFNNLFVLDKWSKQDNRLKPFNSLTPNWQWNTPLRNWFERRQALVEIDVITAMALGLSLEELVLIYNVQFPVLQQNEDDTWYDTKGNIVFTCSKGIVGIGVDRPVWEQIRNLKAGETYEHTITKSELYQGKKITYHAPFDKCDRVEDYKVAWAHFEKVFGK